jgi:hypothetical protein
MSGENDMRSVYYRSIFLAIWLIALAAAASSLTLQPSALQPAHRSVASH